MFMSVETHISDDFFSYHNSHPDIYRLFQQYAYELKMSGRKHYGSKAIMERIRWHMEIERREDFKINNNYASCYARLLMLQNPDFRSFFETRGRINGMD